MAETARQAMDRVTRSFLESIRDDIEPDCTLSPPHDLVPNICVKLAGEWVTYRRTDERGHLVVAKPGSACEWTYEPTDGELIPWSTPF